MLSLRQLGWWVLLIACVGVSGYAVLTYGFQPLGSAVHPDMQTNYEMRSDGIYAHVFGSVVALLLGTLQFSTSIRTRYPQLHRWAGRLYLGIGVLIGGVAGLYMAQYAYGGLVSEVGFAMLAVLWLFTGFMALNAILRKDVLTHQKWMIRNFSLTLGAVTLRIYLGSFFASGMSFDEFYPLLAWISWVPNIILAEWLFVKQKST